MNVTYIRVRGRAGNLVRVPVRRLRRPIRGVAARMRAAGIPPSAIAWRLRVPRPAVDRALRAERCDPWGMAVRAAARDVAREMAA